MVAKRNLTIETLSKLGRRKLAELLIAEAAGNRQRTRTLNLAISAEEGPAALGASLGARLATLAKSRSMLSYDEGRELIAELDGLRTTIVETIGPQESRLAFELLWELIDLHPSILEQVDDSSGRVGTVFRTACNDLGPLAQRANIEPDALAATVFQKVTNNSYGIDRGQSTLLPECLDDYIDESNPVRVIDALVDALDLGELGFDGAVPEATARPSYHPSLLLKFYIYGYLNRVQSSRRLEREAGRNVEVMWLLGRLAPDHKTIADFRKDNGQALRKVCTRFVELCATITIPSASSIPRPSGAPIKNASTSCLPITYARPRSGGRGILMRLKAPRLRQAW
jgi:transposase